MEPVTHLLTGACLSRSGLNRRAAYATAAMVIAAEFPDIDTVWSMRGPITGFQHHRGITHTFLGIPFEAGVLLLAFVLLHRVRSRRGKPPKAPVRWGVLYGLLVLALLSHLLLDYTNNYGLRPFFPFNPHWYAASIVFIFDPLLFLFLVAGLVLPSIFGWIGREVGASREAFRGREVGASREAFRGRGWARAALIGMVLLWMVRWIEHGRAVLLAQTQTLRAPETPAELAAGQPADAVRPLLLPVRSFASPDPLSFFRWYTVTDFGPAYRLAEVDTRQGRVTADDLLSKPPASASLRAAESSHLGRVYLDWSPMPAVRVVPGAPAAAGLLAGAGPGAQTVEFLDPRFMGNTPLLHRAGLPPLTGEVVLGPHGEVLRQGVDGKFGD